MMLAVQRLIFALFAILSIQMCPVDTITIFYLSETPMPERVVARLKGSTGDWEMTLATTEPGLQVYVGPGIEAPLPGLAGTQNPGFVGVALEPQRWPNVVDAQYPMGSFLGTQSGYHQVTTFQFGRQT